MIESCGKQAFSMPNSTSEVGLRSASALPCALAILCCSAAILCPESGLAQSLPSPESNDVAGNRPQPAYDAGGISVSGIRVFPSLAITSAADSNVLTRSTGEQSDIATTIAPNVRAVWERPDSQISLSGDMRIRRYFSLTRQNDEQYGVEASANYQPTGSTRLSSSMAWSRNTATRGTFENGLQVGGPLIQTQFSSRFGIAQQFNRLAVTANLSGERFEFDEVVLDDGTTIDQRFRNGRKLGGSLGLSFEVGPRLSLVAQGNVDKFQYNDNRLAFDRDATGFGATGGLRYEVTRLLLAEAGIGFRKHRFQNPAFSDISGVGLNGRLRWYPTRLISVRFDLSQSTTTSSFDAVSAVNVTTAKLNADYELRRNILITGNLDYSYEDYGTVGGKSQLVTATGQVSWKVNRWMRMSGRVSYDRRFSSGGSIAPTFQTLRGLLTVTFAR